MLPYTTPGMLPCRSKNRAGGQVKHALSNKSGESEALSHDSISMSGGRNWVRAQLDRIAFRYKPGRGITDITHAEAKEILFALGVGKSLYDSAHRGNVADAVKNTLVKQAVALPSRFVKFGAMGVFDAVSSPKALADFGGDRAGLAGHEASRAAQTRMLTYAGQHARGGAHFVLNALANPIDLSSHARSLPPNAFTKDGGVANAILSKLQHGIAYLEDHLPDDLPSHHSQKIKAHLAHCTAALQPEVDRFVDAQSQARPGNGRHVDLLLRSVTELVDTSGKIVIASLLDAAVPGLSRTGIQQLWSLVSYPLMEGVIRTVQNWRDTLAIARVALSQYIEAKDHLARVSDERLDRIAGYAQAHFEPASIANYGRRTTHLFEPKLLELRTRLAGQELDLGVNEAKAGARSLAEFKLIQRRARLRDKSLADEGRIRLSPIGYSASMELVELLSRYLVSSPQLTGAEVDALVEFNIESLLDVHVAPTPQAKAASRQLAAALEAFGITHAQTHLMKRFQTFLSSKRRELELVPGEDTQDLLYPEQPARSTFTDSGRAKLAANAQLDEVARNLRIRRGIAMREIEIDKLTGQIDHLARHPPREGFLDQLTLSSKQSRLALSIPHERKSIEKLRARIDRYAADVDHYKNKRFDAISPGGEVWDDLMTGSTGAAAAVGRNLRYGFLKTLHNRRSLGLAMAAAYDPTLSSVGAKQIFDDSVANSLAEGFLNAGTPMAALTVPLGIRYIRPAAPGLAHTSRGLARSAPKDAEVSEPVGAAAPVSSKPTNSSMQ